VDSITDKKMDPTPKNITKILTDYCLDVTAANHGRSDHATCISFRAGGVGERAAAGLS